MNGLACQAASMLAAFAGGAWALACRRDQRSNADLLTRALRDLPLHGVRRTWTSAGAVLQDLIMLLGHQRWIQRAQGLAGDQLVRDRPPADYEELIENTVRGSGCSLAALVIRSRGLDGGASAFGAAAADRRLREQLVRCCEMAEQGELGAGEVSDALTTADARRDFAWCGCRFSAFVPLRPENGPLHLVWLGYSGCSPPLEAQLERVARYLSRALAELHSSIRISSLNERVCAERRSNDSKSEFITHFSHDLRTPLNNLNSILMFLRSKGGEEEILDAAIRNCALVSNLLDDLLDFARHRAGKLDSSKSVFDLSETVRSIAASFRVVAELKGLIFTIECGDAQPVHADARQIGRVVSNLVSNAIKYTPRGEITVGVDDAGGRPRLYVQDTGCGIDEEGRSLLFMPFSRIGHENISGNGLGLAVARMLVERNGGRFELETAKGRGSRFCCVFDPCERRAGIHYTAPPQPGERGTLDILVVDDDPESAQSLARYISASGYMADFTATIEEAERMIEQQPPGLLITDCRMPHGGAQRLLRKAAKLMGSARVMLLSGCAEALEEFSRDYYFLLKPADHAAILEWIEAKLQPFSPVPGAGGRAGTVRRNVVEPGRLF